MKTFLSTTFPLTIKMLLDLEGIRAHSILSVNLPNNRLVQATVVVIVVMPSMYALIGGSRILPKEAHVALNHMHVTWSSFLSFLAD